MTTSRTVGVIIWTLNCHCTNPIRLDILQLIGVLPISLRMALYITPVYATQFWFYDTPHGHTWLYNNSSVASALWFAKHVAWFNPLQTLQRAVTDSHTRITTRGRSPTNAWSSTSIIMCFLQILTPMFWNNNNNYEFSFLKVCVLSLNSSIGPNAKRVSHRRSMCVYNVFFLFLKMI